MANEKTRSKRTGRSPNQRFLLGAIGLAVAGLVAIAIYAAVSQRGSAEVEEFMHLHGLSVAAWAPDDVFVSSHRGLMRVDPEGEWRFVSDTPHDFMGFQANPTEEGVLYSSGHPAPGSGLPNPVGFMVSEDEGETWAIRSLGGEVDFHVMAVQPSDGDVIYGMSGGLMRSTDAGESWDRIQSDSLAGLGDLYALAVAPEDADVLLLGTGNGLWRSENAGRDWSHVWGEVPVTSVAFGQDRIFMYAASPDRGLMSSRDDGATWGDHGLVLEGQDAVAYIAPHPTREGTLTVGSFEQDVHRTTDSGRNWVHLAKGGVPQEHDHDDHEH